MPSKVELQVELVEKNAEARLKALDKLAKEMGNRKITLNFDEASLQRWKTATDGMTNAQLSSYAKLVTAAESANAKIIAAGQKSTQVEMQQNAKLVTERQKSIDKKIELWEKEDTKRRQIAEKTAQTEINANAKVQAAALKGTQSTKNQTQAQKELNTEAQKTDGIFASITARFTAANLISSMITAAITRMKTALREAVSDMKEINKELTTIKMVTGASDSDISKLRQDAFSGALANGRSVTDYLTASERFARAGYRENIGELTQLSLTTQNVGGVTEDVASKFILAADAAWKLGGSTESLTAILDGMAAVSDQNATDIGKLAEGMTVAGSAFANAGETAQTYTALVGTVTAATQRSGSEVARGLQTILFRVRQVKGELDDGEMISADDISNAAKALDSVGISVLNDAKELKSFSEIMGELNGKWDTLNTKQKAYLQNALAGNRRGNILFALMDNYDVYMRQLEQYEESAGAAAQKNEVYTKSWEAATNNLNTAWTQVVSTITNAGSGIQQITIWATEALKSVNALIQAERDSNNRESVYQQSMLTPAAQAQLSDESKAEFARRAAEAATERGKKLTTALKNQQAEIKEYTEEATEAIEDEMEAILSLADAFELASKNIKSAAEAMKTEKDASVKSAADIYKAMLEAEGKGYYGSNAYTQGASLFFGTSDRTAIKQEAKDALTAYFEGIKEGDYSTAAAELWGRVADEQGNVVDESGNVIATMKEAGDSYEWAFNKGEQSVGEFLQSMQDSTGIGADFWASMIQSLGMYSDEMDKWMEQKEDAAKEPVETEVKAETSEAKKDVEDYKKALDTIPREIQTKVGIVSGGTVSGGSAKLTPFTTSLMRAGGKYDSYSGPAIVNDEFPANGSKPELIISRSTGGAYIANGGRPALVNLRSDDIVLTASQTRSALGVPGFAAGKGNVIAINDGGSGSIFGSVSSKVSSIIKTISPKSTSSSSSSSGSGGGGGSSSEAAAVDPSENWGTLKKLVDYLLEKGNDDLKEQLKVLDDQLDALEAERKAEEESNKLQEMQLAVDNALLDLNKAQVERTVRYYNEETQQWEWMADQKAVQDAQEAYDKALKDLNDYLADQDYEERKAAIEAQKKDLQAQFDAYKDSWDAIVDAIEAPSGDIKALLNELKSTGTSTMKGQSGGIAALLNALRGGLVGSGYQFGLSNINANTSGSSTNSRTTFDSGGIAFGSGIMRKGTVGAEAVIGPGITSDILNPVRNANFNNFAESVRTLMGVANSGAVANKSSFVTNNSGGNIIINGIKIGADMMQKPFAEVMRTISLHVNEAV